MGNACCPQLMVLPCGDTDEHNHLVCGFSKEVISNETATNVCIGNFDKCVLNSKEATK